MQTRAAGDSLTLAGRNPDETRSAAGAEAGAGPLIALAPLVEKELAYGVRGGALRFDRDATGRAEADGEPQGVWPGC